MPTVQFWFAMVLKGGGEKGLERGPREEGTGLCTLGGMSSCPSSLTTSTEGQHQPAGPASGPPPCEDPQRGALLGCLLLEPHPVMMENLGKSILCLRACSSGKNAMDWGQKSLRGCSPMSIPFSVASPSPDLG